mmetsp:Transcript_77128/g.121803  ORF Transcript_77128/g.121803 Transcript_77128/m.121803 type:complete len:157 (-) Transcript_77128:105-575(-)|eukprot:CAMPEP_0169130006 /NCGR_PEP_ID=MMETSP1015-20121227/37460_1 /TAXON_ID=342587 /ORGANISM="Karlodinium micrum, Strain CCMP2283" /LENGTH=156 /DNA_ID=CAMNT_0009194125 /DNA_START=65 /DNA_END=535 /DNA_ORIENTATION=-
MHKILLALAYGSFFGCAQTSELPEVDALANFLLSLTPQVAHNGLDRPRTSRLSVPKSLTPHERWPDLDIFNPDKLDPVYDDPELGAKDVMERGKERGLNDITERLNGRWAMMGFTLLYLQEMFFDKPVLQLYGLPFAEGAQLLNPEGSWSLFDALR